MTGQLALMSADSEVAALIGDLREIGRRLQSRRALEHPRVRAALGQFDADLAIALGQSRGRHRLRTRERAVQSALDQRGASPRKGPLEVTSSAEFISALRQYRAACGNASFRQIAARARHVVPHTAMCVALNSEELPPLEIVLAIVVGCGGGIDDQESFVSAWRRLHTAPPRSALLCGGGRPGLTGSLSR